MPKRASQAVLADIVLARRRGSIQQVDVSDYLRKRGERKLWLIVHLVEAVFTRLVSSGMYIAVRNYHYLPTVVFLRALHLIGASPHFQSALADSHQVRLLVSWTKAKAMPSNTPSDAPGISLVPETMLLVDRLN